jgi:hypothetical protein
MKKRFLVAPVLLGLALLLPRSAAAIWPTNPLVNVPLCTAPGEQQLPTIVSDGAGGAIVTWRDSRSVNADIYAQRISATGTVQWTTNGVALCTAYGDQAYPTIVSDGAGGAIVTWQDYRSDTNCDIYAQRISATGTVQWTANGVAICTASGDRQLPTIVSDGAGGAIVTWSDYRGGAGFDIYAQRISATGTVQWTANGVAICTATSSTAPPSPVSDGAGGAIVAWMDYRSGTNYDIYTQRISSDGTVQWTVDGVALCTATGNAAFPTIVSDGAGGAIVTWQDGRSGYNTYAQRISATGTVRWTVDGVALCPATGGQSSPTITADGAGGAIVTWMGYRSGASNDIYAQRISADGTVLWPTASVALCTATGEQYNPTIASDGAGGAIVTWYDYRSGSTSDIYAQWIGSDGYFLGPEPRIISVTDIPADQGGKVRIKWGASCPDFMPALGISMYGIWRQVEEFAALKAIAAGAKLDASTDGSAEAQPRTFKTTVNGAGTLYWEGVGTVAARGYPTYTFTAWTFEDSTAAGNPYSVFMVDAHSSGLPEYWSSSPDSGYSVDNLSPPAPAPFTGQYASGTATLHWAVNPAADLAEYRLYRGSTAGFVPGPANLVVAQPDTGYVDAAGALYYYRLSAVDVHGNESGFTLLLPSGTVDVPAGTSLAFALEGVRPNPSRGEQLSVAFTLPTTAPATLELVDVSGRRVAERKVGSLGAGRHTLDLGQGQHFAPGLYLVRLTQGTNTRTTRVAVLR